MAKKHSVFLVVFLVVLVGAILIFSFSKNVDGFSSTPTKNPVKLLSNLLAAYHLAYYQAIAHSINGKKVQGKRLDELLDMNMTSIVAKIEKCKTDASGCTIENVSDVNYLITYSVANTVGVLGLPAISYDSLALGPPKLSDVISPSAASQPAT